MPDNRMTAGAPARAPRAPRRAPSELTFDPDRALIESKSADEPDWLAADRRAALARFDELPTESNQLYTPYIDLRAADLGDVRAYPGPAGAPDPTRPETAPPRGAAAFADFDEDRVGGLVVDDAARAAGVTVETLGGLIGRDPETARRLLTDGETLPADDRLAQLTRAGWNQGVVIRVPDRVRLDHPIVVRWAAGAARTALLTRTIVELGDGASASLVEELGSSAAAGAAAGSGQALFTSTLEIRVGRGAELAVASIQDFGLDHIVFQHRRATVGEEGKLHWALAQLGGRLVRSRVDNVLQGDRSSVEQVEIVFGANEQLHDLTSYTRHVGRDTTGNLLSKGVLLDAARTYLKGMIVIEKSAVGTDSFLGEFGMNLSRKARSVAIPSLEIDQPDCRRAAHSSSVGPIDETQLFYLETRGIPPDDARKFIVLGFLEPVVARVPLEAERERLRELLEAKWDAGIARAAAA